MQTDTMTSGAAIGAAITTAAAIAGDQSRELAHVDAAAEGERYKAAQELAADIVKLSIDKLKGAIVGLSIYELARVLEAEQQKGDDARSGAIEAINAQAEKVALAIVDAQSMALEPPAASEPPAADGDIMIDPADLDIPPPAGPDAIAQAAGSVDSTTAALIAEAAASLGMTVVFVDRSETWSDGAVLEHVTNAVSYLFVGRRDFPHQELTAVRVGPGELVRAHDARRVVYAGTIDLSGVGLAAPLPIEQVWLVIETEEGPTIIRRCDMASELTLGIGRHVQFRPNTLIF